MSWRSRVGAALPSRALDVVSALRREVSRLRPLPEPASFPAVAGAAQRLLIGPTNSAGQGWAWARAAERNLADVAATTFAVRRSSFGFADNYGVSVPIYAHPRWQRAQERYVLATFSHVLIESLRPLCGSRYARDASGDVSVLSAADLAVGLVFHGSDIRLPSRHAARERWSPFHKRDELTVRLEEQACRLNAFADGFGGPVFVSTPDLLVDQPAAHWLPVVIDPDVWKASTPLLHRPRPVVVHAPSNAQLKGSGVIEDALSGLAARGLIDYRRLEGIPHARMPAAIAEADVVVDQVLMGLYGVAACEAMAAGRVVVSYVGDDVRARVRTGTGRDLPIVEADPESLAEVVTTIINDRVTACARAEAGVEFVRAIHDGRRSASVLGTWLTDVPG